MADEQPRNDAARAFLADLYTQRDRLNALIDMVEAYVASGMGAPLPTVAVVGLGGTGSQVADSMAALGPGSFLGMSLGEASRQVLAMRRKPMATPEIQAALAEGGIVFSGESPVNAVNAALNRESKRDDPLIVSVGRGLWGLRGWYPNYQRFKKQPIAFPKKADAKPSSDPDVMPGGRLTDEALEYLDAQQNEKS